MRHQPARDIRFERKRGLLPSRRWAYKPCRAGVAVGHSGRYGGHVREISVHRALAVFLIAVALFVLALLGHFVVIPALAVYKFWLAIGAFALLALGNLVKGM